MSRSKAESHPRPAHLAAMSLATLGVVYGDIGTSPLYAIREAFESHDLAVVEELSRSFEPCLNNQYR